MPKILIATPAYGDVFYTPYVRSMFRLLRLMHQRNWDHSFISIAYAEISESRNYLLTHWFDNSDASHILFLDADMGFEPSLIEEMIAFNKPIVGVVYPKRNLNWGRAVELAAKGEPIERAITKAHEFVVRQLPQNQRSKPQNGFLQVEGCGSGILLVQRSCIETMIKYIPEIVGSKNMLPPVLTARLKRVVRAFDVVKVGGLRLSEDYSFCYRWRHTCKGEIWANINHEITHFGSQEIKARFADNLPNVIKGQIKIAIPGKI